MIRRMIACAMVIGCERSSTVAIFPRSSPDDLIIAAVQGEEGELERVEWFLASEEPPVLELRPDDRLSFVAIRDGDLITVEGETFADGLADRIAIYGAGGRSDHGACGRCTAISDRAPQIVHDGDECPIPAFAEHDGDDVPVGDLRIGLDGACPCAPFAEDREAAPPSFELAEDDADGWPYEAVAANAGGTVALFSEARSLVIAESGDRIASEELPFLGRVNSAALAPNGTAFTVSYDQANLRVHAVSADLRAATELEVGLTPTSVVALREGKVLVLGEATDVNPAAFVCDAEPPFPCRPVSFADSTPAGRTLVDAVRMNDGLAVFAGPEGFIAMDHFPVDGADRPTQRAFPHRLGGQVAYAGAAGEWLLACMMRGGGVDVIAAHVDRNVLIPTAPEPVFTAVHSSTFCRAFESAAGTPSARIVFPGGDQARIDGSAGDRVTVEPSGPAFIGGVAVSGARSFDDGATIAWAGELASEVVWSGDRLRYGRAFPSQLHVLISAGDRVIALRDDGAGDVYFEDHSATIDVGGYVEQAVFDSESGTLLLAGPSYLARAPLEGGAPTPISAAVPPAKWVKLVELVPGTFLLVSEDALFVLEDDHLEPIDPEWDDPTTAELEGEPPPCDERFDDASASGGRGYVAGCWGTILEVDPSPPRARRISLLRDSQTLHVEAGVNAVLTAIGAVCPDDVLLGSHGRIPSDYERGRIWELAPSAEEDCADPTYGRCLLDADRVPTPGRFASGFPLAIAGDSEAAIAVFANLGGSVQRVGTDGRFRFPEVLTLAVQAPWGELFVGGRRGHVLRDRLSR